MRAARREGREAPARRGGGEKAGQWQLTIFASRERPGDHWL